MVTINPILSHTIDFVKEKLKNFDAGHDWWHVQRVWNTAKYINQYEFGNATVIDLASLLHDVADSKFYDGDDTIGPATAKDFLMSHNIEPDIIDHVIKIIENISFRKSLGHTEFHSKELEIVQDADRLDAMGAIGIARAFTYGGYKNREIYNPEIPPILQITEDQYKKSTAPTLNHFYEKLLLLKGKMNTTTGKKLAEERHLFMENYLNQFLNEWNCSP